MASSARIVNLTSGFTLKRNQAVSRVGNCIAEWVEYGISIRDLSMTKQFERRAQARAEGDHSPMPFAEIPALMYRPPEYAQASHREEVLLMQETNNRYVCECGECARKRDADAKRAASEARRFMRRSSGKPRG